MKKVIFSLFLFSLLVTGCQKECDIWHEGSKCQTEKRIQYYGTYYGTLTCGSSAQTVVSEYAGDASKIRIGVMVANLTTDGTIIEIPYQTVNSNGTNLSVSGSGYFSGNYLLYNLMANGSACSFTGYK